MARNNSGFEQLKYEIAREVGVTLKDGYNGDLTSAQAGKIGGGIVKKVFDNARGRAK